MVHVGGEILALHIIVQLAKKTYKLAATVKMTPKQPLINYTNMLSMNVHISPPFVSVHVRC